MQQYTTYRSDEDIDAEIRNIFNENKIDDLKKFLNKRACLNKTNHILIYLFHIIQSAGVLTTTIAAGYDMKELIWIGVGMNILASLINVFEKTNDSMSKRIMKDIQAIKTGTYVDEGTLIELDTKAPDKPSNSTKISSDISDNDSQKNDIEQPKNDKQTAKSILKTPLISEESKNV